MDERLCNTNFLTSLALFGIVEMTLTMTYSRMSNGFIPTHKNCSLDWRVIATTK